jgi:putative membrane protein
VNAFIAETFVTPSDVWRSWSFEPSIVGSIALLVVLYVRGYLFLRARGSQKASPRTLLAFAGGVTGLAIALISPLDAMSDALFSAHMMQHLFLIVVVPPLLVLGRTTVTVMLGLPVRVRVWAALVRRRLGGLSRFVHRKVVAWALFTIALWGWHLPGPYQTAVRSWPVHAVEHLCFLGTSSLVWSIAMDGRMRAALGGLERSLLLIAASLQSGILGAVLLFASRPLYPVHGIGPSLWGLTPLQDQQLAGALMWIPPSAVYLTMAAVVSVRWFRSMDRRSAPVRQVGERAAGSA